MGEMTNLYLIGMDSHRLSGAIPNSFSSVRGISIWSTSENELSGAIPDAFGRMLRLSHLSSRYNKLCGVMPHAVSLGAELHKLGVITLSYNVLSGPVLEGIAALRALRIIELQVNRLSGHIPDAFANVEALMDLHLTSNRFSWSNPRCDKRHAGHHGYSSLGPQQVVWDCSHQSDMQSKLD